MEFINVKLIFYVNYLNQIMWFYLM